jgi:LysR family transcriptional regulator (chromosome initiation inhibitor)
VDTDSDCSQCRLDVDMFTAVLCQLTDVLFDVRIEGQDHSARLLREGAVMGAVTTDLNPVPGCRARSLGVMRYVPVPGRLRGALSI